MDFSGNEPIITSYPNQAIISHRSINQIESYLFWFKFYLLPTAISLYGATQRGEKLHTCPIYDEDGGTQDEP